LRRGGPGSCPVLPRAPGRGLRDARLAAAPDLPPRLAARLPRRGNWAGAAASRWHPGAPGSGLAGIPGPWTREVAAWQICHPVPAARCLPPATSCQVTSAARRPPARRVGPCRERRAKLGEPGCRA
jgi:hypothetical protein